MKGQRKIKFPYLLNSKWTSTKKIMGWRHFQVVSREERKTMVFAQLQSVCDPAVNCWMNARMLGNRDLWEPGWTTLTEMTPDPEEEVTVAD